MNHFRASRKKVRLHMNSTFPKKDKYWRQRIVYTTVSFITNSSAQYITRIGEKTTPYTVKI